MFRIKLIERRFLRRVYSRGAEDYTRIIYNQPPPVPTGFVRTAELMLRYRIPENQFYQTDPIDVFKELKTEETNIFISRLIVASSGDTYVHMVLKEAYSDLNLAAFTFYKSKVVNFYPGIPIRFLSFLVYNPGEAIDLDIAVHLVYGLPQLMILR